MRKAAVRAALIAALLVLCWSAFADPLPISDEMLLNAANEPNNWITYGRDYSNTRFSPLKQIGINNAKQLTAQWSFSFGVLEGQTTTPLVNNGVMYVTSSWSKVFALDAKTGEMLWRYDPALAEDVAKYACCDVVNRGVALYQDKVYLATLDMHVVALNAKTGKVVWDKTLADYKDAYTFTVAPLVARGKVYVGTSNGEYPIRGFIEALDATTGNSVWRTYTVPPPGEPGGETWGGDPGSSALVRHGSPALMTPRTTRCTGARAILPRLGRGLAPRGQPLYELHTSTGSRHGQDQIPLSIHASRYVGLRRRK